MRKIRLNSSIAPELRRKLLEDMKFFDSCKKAIEMFVTTPADNVERSIQQVLREAQKRLDTVMEYMGVTSVYSARLPVGGENSTADSQFLEDADSVLGLEDGQSINLSKAQLLYNEETLELILTDEETIPDGFAVVGIVQETEDSDNAAENAADAKESEDDSTESEADDNADDDSPANATEDDEGQSESSNEEGGIL